MFAPCINDERWVPSLCTYFITQMGSLEGGFFFVASRYSRIGGDLTFPLTYALAVNTSLLRCAEDLLCDGETWRRDRENEREISGYF